MSDLSPHAELVPAARLPSRAALHTLVREACARAATHRTLAIATHLHWDLSPVQLDLHWGQVPMQLGGVGEAWTCRVRGAQGLARLREGLDALWARVEAVGEAPPVAPRVFGGLAFAAGGAAEPEWTGFGDGAFVLPRWTVGDDGEVPFVSFAVDGAGITDVAAEAARACAELDGLLDRRGARREPPRWLGVEHADEAAWKRAVERVREEIAAGRLSKAVLARRSTVRLAGPVDEAAVLGCLRARFPSCTCFKFRRGAAAFLGATPERLFEKRGRRVSTEALAGSIDARAPGAAEALLGSAKDRSEHAFVVDDVVRRLLPLATSVRVSEHPEIRALRHVLHMRTPIEADVRGDVHAVDLLGALHPTPAVGGVPTDEALSCIERLEPVPRGWYAGPIGWIDARGDAEVMVALRSGLLHGDRAWVYAGAGIVEGSDPDAEWEEAALKMRALIEALGAPP